MAFLTKYQIVPTSDVYEQITINIKQDNYNGPIIQLDGAGRDWIKLKIGKNTQDITEVVMASSLVFSFYCKEDFQTIELGETEPYSFLVEVTDSVLHL